MAGKKILMLTGDFSEEYEIFVFEQAMHAIGHTVHVVCPDKKAGDILKTSLHDFEGDLTYTEKPGHNYVLNKSFDEVKPEQYDAVYCAGGRGPEYIRINPRVQEIVRHFHEAEKPIFTICHGVQILVAVDGVVRGKSVSGARRLRARGAAGRRDLRRHRRHRGARGRHDGLGQGLDGAGGLHARVPEGARHRGQARRGAGEGGLVSAARRRTSSRCSPSRPRAIAQRWFAA